MIRAVAWAGVASLLAASGCKADLPELSDAKGTLDTRCNGPYADLVLDVSPTSLDGNPVLGAPDGMTVTLSSNVVVTVGFIGLGGVTEASGPDIRITADVPSGATATVYVAGTDMEFERATDLTSSTKEIDIAVALSIPTAVYVRITGVAGSITLDAVEAVHDTCP